MERKGSLISFVILHYNAIEETINCVNSIKEKIDTANFRIVIVDNASPNHTGEVLKKRYIADEKIVVIINDTNLGFAKGNNVGYKYAVEDLKSDFVCIMNNDTLLVQDDFFDVIQKEYETSNFGVMGPKIILKNGKINAIMRLLPDVTFFENEIRFHQKEMKFEKMHLHYVVSAIRLAKILICKCLRIKPDNRYGEYETSDHLDERHENIILHGCCLVFSPHYIQLYREAFHPDTFLYKEEELLFLRCQKKELVTVYNPKLLIKHLEDVATNSVTRKRKEKRIAWHRYQIDSLKVLVKELGIDNI